jgi:hypothetical protein
MLHIIVALTLLCSSLIECTNVTFPGVIIKQQDLRKTIKDISTRLKNCESENAILKSDKLLIK